MNESTSEREQIDFGRADQHPLQRWSPVIAFTLWGLYCWLTGRTGLIAVSLVIAAMVSWGSKEFDRAARVERGYVTLRSGRRNERIAADGITDISLEETTGWLSRSVHVRIHRGRFDSFDVLGAKAPKTAEGRRRLQARIDAALLLLRSRE